MTALKTFYYILRSKDGDQPESSVEAENKTGARKAIAEAYRMDTPSRARSAGFIPFSDCRIIWTREDEYVSDYSEICDGVIATPIPEEQPDLHPAIGILMRDGKPVYYFHKGPGRVYTEGSVSELTSLINQESRLHS